MLSLWLAGGVAFVFNHSQWEPYVMNNALWLQLYWQLVML